MKAKLCVLFLVAMMVSAGVGTSYASYTGGIHFSNCCPECYCDVKFIDATASDNEFEDDVVDPKDVGSVSAQIVDDNTITVQVDNAYPLYRAYITFILKNTGSMPLHIDEVYLEDYDTTALYVEVTDVVACMWIDPGETATGMVTVEVLQAAKQNWQYPFHVDIKVSCQQKQHPRTIGFWKHQFSAALLGSGKLHIPDETLEQYLDGITGGSGVYSFTGAQTEKFNDALAILEIPHPVTMEGKLKAQLLALWLNYMAGWTAGYILDGMTAYDIITGSETALNTPNPDSYEYWKDMCDGFNNLK